MKKILFTMASVVTISSAAFAIYASIIGKWEIVSEDKGAKYTMSIDLFENVSTFAMKCEVGGQSVDVSVTVATKVEGNVYHVLGSESMGKKIGGVNCRVDVTPVSYTFEASEARLRLNTPDGQVIFLNRVR